jgi:hypothetical protein
LKCFVGELTSLAQSLNRSFPLVRAGSSEEFEEITRPNLGKEKIYIAGQKQS